MVEIDFNAAEVRTLFALQGKKQPQQDIHSWVSQNIYNGEVSRDDSKIKLFSWLYNFSASDSRLEKFFSRQIFRDFYCNQDNLLKTPYGRVIQVEEKKAQNYLLQSTTSDIVVENSYNIVKFLKERKSKVSFTMHDSIVLDMSRKESSLLKEIKQIFENTPWGSFVSSCKIGKNFGEMKRIEI